MSYYPAVKTLSAKQYNLNATRAATVIPDSAGAMYMTEFTLAFRFKCNTVGTIAQNLYADAFFWDQVCLVRVDDVGLFSCAYLTLSGIVAAAIATPRVDDGAWHMGAFVREASPNMFRSWLDGTEGWTDATDPGIQGANQTKAAFGNTHPDEWSGDDRALEGTIASGYIVDKPMSWAQIDTLLRTGQPPAGMNILVPLNNGGDTSTVEAVLGP